MNQKGKLKLLYAGIFLSLVSWVVEIVFGKYEMLSKGIWFILNFGLFILAACVLIIAYYNIKKYDKSFMLAFIFGIITIAAVIVKIVGLAIGKEGLISVVDIIIGIGAGSAPCFAIAGIRNTIAKGSNDRSFTIIESGKAIQWCFGVMDILYSIALVLALLTWIFKLDTTTFASILNDFTECLAVIGYGAFTHFIWECTLIDEELGL